MHPTDIDIPKGMYLTAKEFQKMSMMMRTREGFLMAMKLSMRTIKNLILGKDMNALGLSLMGRLRMVLKENNIPLWLKSSFTEILTEENKVVGAIIDKDGEKLKILTAKGILLATGGFDHNSMLRKENLPDVAQENFSSGAKENVGDALTITKKLNPSTDLMDDAWWMPAVKLPSGKMFTLVSERAIPSSIIVGDDGKRFTNESSPYVNFVHDQIKAGWKTVWQILDQKAVNRYMYAGKPPRTPFPKSWYKIGIIFKAKTIEELAKLIDVDIHTLSETVAHYNEDVKVGKDSLFARGENAYDRYYGDPTLENPVLDYINKGPYYAVKVLIGDLGTKGGIETDKYARVLTNEGTRIVGLYATGNVSASVMGRDYAGAGGTIGPSMIFGYVATKHAVKGDFEN
jgi:3-oxosteroid 1-dehydrogenase